MKNLKKKKIKCTTKQNKTETENISLNPSEMLEGIEELPGQMELEGP